MVIAAKTGQGKTLCFGIPILDICVRKLEKTDSKTLDSLKGLILSPTRELAIQIKDMLEAVIPVEYEKDIRICALVGGMSIQKQLRLLKYKPAIIIATPGRLWELLSDHSIPYLRNGLPMIDVLVLDEADRMIADGHFKEMKDILAHIYTTRVAMKNSHKNNAEKPSIKHLKEID